MSLYLSIRGTCRCRKSWPAPPSTWNGPRWNGGTVSQPRPEWAILMLGRRRDRPHPFRLQQFRHQPRPPRLMACAKPRPIIAMEIFKEKDIILEIRIGLQFCRRAIDRPQPFVIPQEDPSQPLRKLHADLIQRI